MFEWDETKRLATLKKHGIDFIDAVEIFADTYLKLPGKGDAERRYIAIGVLGGVHIAVVYTIRNGMIRLITARRARRNEREDFRALHAKGSPADERQN